MTKGFVMVILFIIGSNLSMIYMDTSLYTTKFNKIDCSISEKKTCINPFCYITTDNQSITYLSFGCTLTRPLPNFQVALIMYKKSGNSYRLLLKPPAVDFCDIIKSNKVNQVMKQALNFMRDTYPSLFKTCPWTVELEFLHKFTKISCEVSEKRSCDKPFCYITTSKTSLSLASYGCTLTRTVQAGNFTMQQFYKYGKEYREIVKSPTVDWNTVTSGKKLNPFFQIMINMMKKAAPSIFRKFPWTGNFEVYNLSLENHNYFSIFPKGDYKTVFWFGDQEDEISFKVTIISTLTTPVELS
ncbi:unnamed protein product [Diamesa hyperborea]